MIDLSLMGKKQLAKVFDYSVLPKDTTEAGNPQRLRPDSRI